MIEFIKAQFKKQKYEFIDNNISYFLNIFAVRTENRLAGRFDDFLYVVYRDYKQDWRIHQWQVTTDPGTYWLKHPLRVSGTAILVPGQYIDTYKIGEHKGASGNTQQALVQRNGEVSVYRDNDKDYYLDFKEESIEHGYFGINIHGRRGNFVPSVNYKWSAGCIVFSSDDSFKQFMKLTHKHREIHDNQFTFTLFNENQFNINDRSTNYV